jgi:hypothetical protein
MRDLLANKHIRSLAIALGGAAGAALTSWAASTDLGPWGPLVGAGIAWILNAVKVWWSKAAMAVIVLLCCATCQAAPRATIDGPHDKSITLTVAVAGSEPVTITLPAAGAVIPVPVPVPVPIPVPPVLPPNADTMGIRLQVIAAAKLLGDKTASITLADKAAGLAAKIRAGSATSVQAVATEIGSTAAAINPRLATALKALLQGLIASGKLSGTDLRTWATLLEELAAALRESAQ